MKKFIIIFITITALFTTFSCAIADTGDYGVGIKNSDNITITLDQLANMPEYQRNQILNAHKTTSEGEPVALVKKSIEFIEGVNIDGLSLAAGKVADAVVIFCSKLGMGVENALNSKLGWAVIFVFVYHIGIISSIVNTIICFGAIMVLTCILIAANTTKTKVVKIETFDGEGKPTGITKQEVLLPKFNAFFTSLYEKVNKLDKDEQSTVDEIEMFASIYRVVVSAICVILNILLTIAICL